MSKVLEAEMAKMVGAHERRLEKRLEEHDAEWKLQVAALKAEIDQLRGPSSWGSRR